jgi:FkbM family methyltransferase
MLISSLPKRILRRARRSLGLDLDRFLWSARGVIHVGASVGQERAQYAGLGLEVLWVEPIPEVFATLRANIAALPRQNALQALVADIDGRDYEFHIANNAGQSSSILELKDHRDVWPEVSFTKSITIRGTTLPTLLAREGIDVSRYDALIMDTQGSERMVLKGAAAVLPHFNYIKTEAADFEIYEGCAQLKDLTAFLATYGFAERARSRFASRAAGGHSRMRRTAPAVTPVASASVRGRPHFPQFPKRETNADCIAISRTHSPWRTVSSVCSRIL